MISNSALQLTFKKLLYTFLILIKSYLNKQCMDTDTANTWNCICMIHKNMLPKGITCWKYILTESPSVKSSNRKTNLQWERSERDWPRPGCWIWKGAQGKILVIEIIFIFFWVQVTWVYATVKIHQTEHLGSAHFIVQ